MAVRCDRLAFMTYLPVRTRRLAAICVACALPVIFQVCQAPAFAQAESKRLLHVAVTDPLGRYVTGLLPEHFEVVENGVRRPLTGFADADSTMSLAIVSDTPVATVNLDHADALIQTKSLTEAVRQLLTTKSARKALVVVSTADVRSIPTGIQVVRADPDGVVKTVIELRNQYQLEVESWSGSAAVEVLLKQPRGLPLLRPILK